MSCGRVYKDLSLPQSSLLKSRLTPGPRKSLTKTVSLSLVGSGIQTLVLILSRDLLAIQPSLQAFSSMFQMFQLALFLQYRV